VRLVFGMHGCFKAEPGKGPELEAILLEAADALRADERCLLYVVSRGIDDPDAIWVSEAWTDREAHDASLRAPGTPEMIARARPLIAGMEGRAEFAPVGGKGLSA
jgi:quinol monooxygenase YgiN